MFFFKYTACGYFVICAWKLSWVRSKTSKLKKTYFELSAFSWMCVFCYLCIPWNSLKCHSGVCFYSLFLGFWWKVEGLWCWRLLNLTCFFKTSKLKQTYFVLNLVFSWSIACGYFVISAIWLKCYLGFGFYYSFSVLILRSLWVKGYFLAWQVFQNH